jgi:gliding motility-associated-like protein
VEPLPVITASISNPVVCSGNTVSLNATGASSYTWTGGVANGQPFVPVASGSYSVTGTSSAGCTGSNTATVSVTVNSLPQITAAASSTNVCYGDSVTLSAGGGNTYTWTGLPGTIVSPSATSTFSVSGSDSNGCMSTATIAVTVNPLPVISILSSDSVSCPYQSVSLSAAGAITYTWNVSSITPSMVVSPSVSTVFTLFGTDINGCVNSTQFTQSVSPCGVLSATSSYTALSCSGRNDGSISIELANSYPNSVINYSWTPTSVCPSNNCNSADSLSPGKYKVMIRVSYTVNGSTISDSLELPEIEIEDRSVLCDLKIPTGIIPNSALNNKWSIENIDLYPDNSVSIFNRWGEEVFHIKGYNNEAKSWPSSGEKSKLTPSTYFYVIDPGNGAKPVKGWIEVMMN